MIYLNSMPINMALKVAQANAAGKPAANLTGSNTPIEFKLGRQGIHLISTGLSRKLSLDAKVTAGESESVKVDAGTKHRAGGKQWTFGGNAGEHFLRESTKRRQKWHKSLFFVCQIKHRFQAVNSGHLALSKTALVR